MLAVCGVHNEIEVIYGFMAYGDAWWSHKHWNTVARNGINVIFTT